MKPADLKCWKCGASLADVLLPLSRLAKCRACNADLHVCRMCEFFDTTVNNSCREPVAEKVNDKTRKNFCGYLQPSASAYTAADVSGEAAARGELDALFGLDTGQPGQDGDKALSAEDEARQKLEALFNPDKKS